MNTVNVAPEAAEDALVRLAGHVPADVVIGRPYVAIPSDDAISIFTDTAVWWVYPDRADRVEELPDGRSELVEYRDGHEQSRTISVIE